MYLWGRVTTDNGVTIVVYEGYTCRGKEGGGRGCVMEVGAGLWVGTRK